MPTRHKIILHGYLPLLIGSLIYILFRPYSLLMFRWFEVLKIDSIILFFRNSIGIYKDFIPDIVIYSFPNGLWTYSLISNIILIWNNEKNYYMYFWIIIAVIISLGGEIGQAINVIPGTFDFLDLILISLGIYLPFIFLKDERSVDNAT